MKGWHEAKVELDERLKALKAFKGVIGDFNGQAGVQLKLMTSQFIQEENAKRKQLDALDLQGISFEDAHARWEAECLDIVEKRIKECQQKGNDSLKDVATRLIGVLQEEQKTSSEWKLAVEKERKEKEDTIAMLEAEQKAKGAAIEKLEAEQRAKEDTIALLEADQRAKGAAIEKLEAEQKAKEEAAEKREAELKAQLEAALMKLNQSNKINLGQAQ